MCGMCGMCYVCMRGGAMDLLTLARQDTGAPFPRAASSHGGEHKGPCPFCRAGDDRFCVWPDHEDGKARFWCRVCAKSGDLIDYLRDLHGMTFAEAKRAAGMTYENGTSHTQKKRPDPPIQPPSDKWQRAARGFVQCAQRYLWTDDGLEALYYLQNARGLDDDTIRHFGLGYNPSKMYRDPERWGGLECRAVYLSPGIVIPCEIDGALWYVQTRRPYLKKDGKPDYLGGYLRRVVDYEPERKYWAVKGSTGRALFGADDLRGDRPLLFCEGEFDAMLAWQELGDLVDVCTMGGASKGGDLPARWLLRLLPYADILIAYDVDENGAGDKGAAALLRQSKRARRAVVPSGGDLGGFWLEGGDLRAWLGFYLDRA